MDQARKQTPPSWALKGLLLISLLGVWIHSVLPRVPRKAGPDRARQAATASISRGLVVPFHSGGHIPGRCHLFLPCPPLDRWQQGASLQRGNRFDFFLNYSWQKSTWWGWEGSSVPVLMLFPTYFGDSPHKPWEYLTTPTFWGGTVDSRSWRKERKTIGEGQQMHIFIH